MRPIDDAEQLLLDNVTGLLNMHTAKNPYALPSGAVHRVKVHRARMKLVTETLLHRIEKDGPTVDSLLSLASAFNDLAEFNTAQAFVEQALQVVGRDRIVPHKSIAFMVTDVCNLRCKHCFIFNEGAFDPVPREAELTGDEYVELFQSLASSRQNVAVHLTGGGECFARRDFEEILGRLVAADRSLRMSIQTNGQFPGRLRDMLANDDLRRSLDLVQFSLDGMQETHDSIRGTNTFGRLVESITVAVEARVPVSVVTTVQEANIDALQDLKAFSASLGVEAHRFQLFFEGAKPWLADISRAVDFFTDRERSLMYHGPTAPGAGCLGGIIKCIVRPDGVVETCRESYSGNVPRRVLGNVRQHGLDLPQTLTSDQAISTMLDVKNCRGCACFCGR